VSTVSAASIEHREAQGSCEPDSAPLSPCRVQRSTGRRHSKPASFRLQGLVTLVTVFSRRNRVGLVSCRQRSWDSPFGAFSSAEVETRFRAAEPACRFSCGFHTFAEAKGRPRRPRLPGFHPQSGVPRDGRAINTHIAGCSRGLFPFRAFGANPGRASPAASLALRLRLASMPRAGTPESFELSPDPDRSRF
jgi:hypothetical protein